MKYHGMCEKCRKYLQLEKIDLIKRGYMIAVYLCEKCAKKMEDK